MTNYNELGDAMPDKLICPECGSDYVQHLAIGDFNPYMYLCRECGEQWGDVREEKIIDESSIPQRNRNSLLECEIVWSETPSPNVIYNKWYEVDGLENNE